MTQGTQTEFPSGRVGWGGKWEEGSRGREHMYTYGCFMLMFGRSEHNSEKQLSFD